MLPKIGILNTSILITESKIDIEIEELYSDTKDKENKIYQLLRILLMNLIILRMS